MCGLVFFAAEPKKVTGAQVSVRAVVAPLSEISRSASGIVVDRGRCCYQRGRCHLDIDVAFNVSLLLLSWAAGL